MKTKTFDCVEKKDLTFQEKVAFRKEKNRIALEDLARLGGASELDSE